MNQRLEHQWRTAPTAAYEARYAALLAKIKAGVADRYTMGRVRKCAADCARASGTKAARFFDAAAESVARATIFG
jgi:hypothetical protein